MIFKVVTEGVYNKIWRLNTMYTWSDSHMKFACKAYNNGNYWHVNKDLNKAMDHLGYDRISMYDAEAAEYITLERVK